MAHHSETQAGRADVELDGQLQGARMGWMQPERITLYADYVEWPLWGPRGGPFHEDELPLTESTKLRIKAWFNAYDEPRADWPIWKAPQGLSAADEEQAWVDEGEAIRRVLEAELGEPVAYKT